MSASINKMSKTSYLINMKPINKNIIRNSKNIKSHSKVPLSKNIVFINLP